MQIHIAEKRSIGEKIQRKHQYETTLKDAETRQVLMEAARSFIGTIEFYKSEFGGAKSHGEAVKEALNVLSGEEGMSKVYRSRKLVGDTCRQLMRLI